MSEIDRLQAFTGSSLSKCRPSQLSLHFRAELPEFNVIGSGCGPNPVALKFKCKNTLSKKSKISFDGEKKRTSYYSTWRIRHPEMSPGGQISVPILYDGEWSRAALISLIFVVHNKKYQHIAYSKGEILLVDDLCEERFSLLMTPRSEISTEDLKVPVLIHLFIDVWDVDAGNVLIRSAKKLVMPFIPVREAGEVEENRLMYERIESITTDQEDVCTWPETTDFLIEIAIQSEIEADTDSKSRISSPCGDENCDGRCAFDENANLVVPIKRTSVPTSQRCVQFFCHQSKLARESSVFEEMFDSEWTKDANVLRVRSFSPSAVEMFLNFIYNNRLQSIDLPEHCDGDSRIDYNDIIQVVSLAKRYEVERLKSYCDALLADRYLNLFCAADIILIAERYELPLLGQAALSLLSWSLDEEYLQPLINHEDGKHLLNEVIREARRKHMFSTLINPC